MRIATWNVNSLTGERIDRVVGWLDIAEPDVLCLQETKQTDDAFPALDFHARGYASVHHGEGRWNGVAILSRVGLDDPVAGFADGEPDDDQARLVTATCGGVRVSSVYVPNGRAVGHEHFRYKLRWLARLRAHLLADTPPPGSAEWPGQPDGTTARRVVCGDFNVAPDDLDLWNPQAFEGSTHVTPEERAAVAELEALGLRDVFREQYPAVEGLFSWWDYRAGAFHKHRGMRIDLVLASDDIAERVTWALIDRNARKGTKPSDHAPVIVDVGPGPGPMIAAGSDASSTT
ncbi:MAG: exodeoxyribonuclease III [Acidimicrobiales bacterium]|nr:exodeoxyribonuclease III [Acidimicrobiales bacterium]